MKIKTMMKIYFLIAGLMILNIGCNRTDSNVTGVSVNENVSVIPDEVITDTTSVPVHITKAFFIDNIMDYEKSEEWDYKGNLPAIVDFYATWCPPCKVSNPILEELAEEYSGQIKVYKVDVDLEQELASVFGIQSIPSFLFIPVEGQPVMSQGIARTVEETKAMFESQISEILKVSATRL